VPVLETPPESITCDGCGKTRRTTLTAHHQPRTPQGWHKRQEALYCEQCWDERYLLRAVSMPIAEPVGCSWEELRKDVKALWAQTTRASNWIMTQLFIRDVQRGKDDAKMPPMARVYLYPELRQRFPGLAPQTVASLEQACQKKYRSVRYGVVWTAAEALPTFRYPTPVPIHNQSWSARIVEDKPIVRLRLAPSGAESATREVRLKSGPEFRRQYAQFRLIARGEAIPGEAAVYQRGKRLMLKMVAWLPREEPQALRVATGVLRVSTGKDSLLVAVNAKDERLWKYHADHLRRWSSEHRRVLQRWSDDQKYEQRPVPAFAARRAAAAAKYRDRMHSATHEIAAELAAYAARRRFAQVRYDDTERGFCEGFPWYRLRALIEEKLSAQGIGFVASGPAETNEPGPVAEG
jgi:hypothetical protein